MFEGDTWHVVEPREIHVLDRIEVRLCRRPAVCNTKRLGAH